MSNWWLLVDGSTAHVGDQAEHGQIKCNHDGPTIPATTNTTAGSIALVREETVDSTSRL